MINDDRFESSEFYNKRYGTFTTKLLYPVFIFLIFITVFAIFTKKEIVVKSIASIEPNKPLAVVQSTSNNAVIMNKLKDGKIVYEGQTLIKFDDKSIKNEKNVLYSKIHKNDQRLNYLNIYKNSVINNQNLFDGSDKYGYESLFNDYMAQLSNLNITAQQNNSDIQSTDNQQIKKNSDVSRTNSTLANNKQSLKSKLLADINEQISNVRDSDIDLTGKEELSNIDDKNQKIKSPETGILHVKDDNYKPKYFQAGSEIAEIYPKLISNTKLVSKFYIPANKLNNIKKGQKIIFRSSQDGPKPLTLTGKIKSISNVATKTKEGSLFLVVADVNNNDNNYRSIRYGMTGDVSVITGRKTWFNYVKDLILK